MRKTVIIGAGPAGLGAGAYLVKNDANVLILEKDTQVGGISKTLVYKDCRFDIGGHRFFTDIEEIERLWHETLGNKFIKRPRLSRILYNDKFFDYPLVLTSTIKSIGLVSSFLSFSSYLNAQLGAKKAIVTFEDYITKHFGKRLYKLFFKTYTEKVWGIPCTRISADWAKERITGLSMISAITNALAFGREGGTRTLIKEFYYPVLGPGMMYERIAENIIEAGGEIKTELDVVKLLHNNKNILSVIAKAKNGQMREISAKHLISSMPITEFIEKLEPAAPKAILEANRKLQYRNLITVNLICRNKNIFPDNWIYVHSPKIKLCRIQNYKNWSAGMVPDTNKTTLGLEYFCSEGDALWAGKDEEIINLAVDELTKTGFIVEVEDAFVVRVPNAYPVYALGYESHLKTVTDYVERFENLHSIGRAGRFRYDNMDTAMASGLLAARIIQNKISASPKAVLR